MTNGTTFSNNSIQYIFKNPSSAFIMCDAEGTPRGPPVWNPSLACPPAPHIASAGEQLGALERFLTAHQTEMKSLLSGALGSLSQRLEVLEHRMDQLCEQSSSHGSSLKLLHSRMGQLGRGLGSTSPLSPPAMNLSPSPRHGEVLFFKGGSLARQNINSSKKVWKRYFGRLFLPFNNTNWYCILYRWKA